MDNTADDIVSRLEEHGHSTVTIRLDAPATLPTERYNGVSYSQTDTGETEFTVSLGMVDIAGPDLIAFGTMPSALIEANGGSVDAVETDADGNIAVRISATKALAGDDDAQYDWQAPVVSVAVERDGRALSRNAAVPRHELGTIRAVAPANKEGLHD